MTERRYVVAGLLQNRQDAIRIIEVLKRRAYDEEQISIVARDEEDREEVAEKTGAEDALASLEENATKKGLGLGLSSGMLTGGFAGLLAELAAFTLPGVGPVIAAGPLLSTLTGAAVGAGAGGLIGGLIGYGVPKEDARHYEQLIQSGHVLVVVETNTEAESNSVLKRFSGHQAKDAHIYEKKST
ncbi:low temperature-induced protein [Bacillaceae bacterium SIJ1]|uniref:low temperature-induced protein n=1 Tax=Litoribacterium kuwaitense TaxID=1398745 RepID=UPI0013EB2143|nr:low temperature-induced protein [Litoribacterium kuwaitense]NGP44679.1 low temperature-induced protein [Litoribacterium kuwaitense]